MTTDETDKATSLSEIRAIDHEQTEISFYKKNCSVCASGKLNEIHALRPHLTLVELADRIKKDFEITLTKDSLSRHFQHYNTSVQVESVKKQLTKFEQEAENVGEHQKKTLFLAKISFDHIIERIENRTLELGVDDFEKLLKLYYGVLRDPDKAGDENILAIFQRASEKFGCAIEQGVLVKMPKKEV